MADWKDRLLPASFRGVPFFIESHEFSTGRRSQQHEFPDRDTPFAEDLGRRARGFTVDGYVLGDDYFTLRDNLIAAVETEGSGELIHPYLGNKQVQCDGFVVREQTKEGRIARFTFTFLEAGEFQFPTQAVDKQATLLEKTETAKEVSKGIFDDAYTVIQQPGFVVDSARDGMAAATEKITEVTKPVAVVSDAATDLAFSTRQLLGDLDELIRTPDKLSTRFLGSIDLLKEVGATPKDRLNAYRGFDGFTSSDEVINPTTSSRQQQLANKQAVDNFVEEISVLNQVEQAADVEFASTEEAGDQRDELVEKIDNILKRTDNDDLVQSMRDVKASLVETVPDVDDELPSIVEVTPKSTVPSLVLTYDLFEDPRNEQDIIDRNSIRHPGFIPAGKALEVLDR